MNDIELKIKAKNDITDILRTIKQMLQLSPLHSCISLMFREIKSIEKETIIIKLRNARSLFFFTVKSSNFILHHSKDKNNNLTKNTIT